MSDTPNIIPFGKHKGKPIEELIADDPKYLEWLSGQDWFRDKFSILYQVIINRGPEIQETPEHNAMQVKFLDDDYRARFLRHVGLKGDVTLMFEEDGIDVKLEAIGSGFVCCVELKPTVGDDYPAVLRQIKRNQGMTSSVVGTVRVPYRERRSCSGRSVRVISALLVGNYSGSGATREQFVKTMEMSNVRVVFADEIEGAQDQ